MAVFLLLVLMACPIFAVLLAVTALSPSWHWVLAFMILVGGVLGYAWVQSWIASSAPGYRDSPGGLGIAIVGMWSLAFTITSVFYGAGLIWWKFRE